MNSEVHKAATTIWWVQYLLIHCWAELTVAQLTELCRQENEAHELLKQHGLSADALECEGA